MNKLGIDIVEYISNKENRSLWGGNMGVTHEKAQEMWNSVYPRLIVSQSDKGPKNKPIIVSTSSEFIGEPSPNGMIYMRNQWNKLPDYLKEPKETKRIFSDLDPYGEENWEE